MHSLETVEIPSTVKIIGENEFNDCKNIKEVKLHNGLEIIGYRAFGSCYMLKTIEIPSSVKRIGESAFNFCNCLEEVKLHNGVEVIGGSAFYGCRSLKTIEIPSSVKRIGEKVFFSCRNLEEIKLHNGLEEIGSDAFYGCNSLKTIEIPSSVKRIGAKVFFSCENLEEVKLHNGLEEIGGEAFCGCDTLKEIELPSSVKKIGENAFLSCKNLKKVIIKYSDYESLKEFIKVNVDSFTSLCRVKNSLNNKNIDLIFEGSKLTIIQKLSIQHMLVGNSFNISFLENNDVDKEQDYKEQENKDNEIEQKINQINKLCSYLPNETRNKVLNKVNNLLSKYENDMEKSKPKFGGQREILELDSVKDVKTLKPILLANLDAIILDLSSLDSLIKYLETLNGYKGMMDNNIESLKEDDSKLENIISNIIYLSRYLQEERKNEVLNTLSSYIDKAIDGVSNNIDTIFEKNLSVNNDIDYKTELGLDINSLYDSVLKESKKIKPYKILLENISKDKVDSYSEEEDIISLINNIKYIIARLSNSKYKTDLEKEINDILQKYIDIINNIINNKEKLENSKYEDIEKDLRKELQPILEKIRNYAYMDKYEIDKGNKTNIISQLLVCVDLISNNAKVELTDDTKLQPITSYIIEINNKIVSNKLIDSNVKREIKNKLIEILNNNIADLEDDTIDTLEEYNEVLGKIMKDIAGIDLDIKEYLKDVEDYNKAR